MATPARSQHPKLVTLPEASIETEDAIFVSKFTISFRGFQKYAFAHFDEAEINERRRGHKSEVDFR